MVQFERLWVRVRNMDKNLAKACRATQATAKGVEEMRKEMKEIKSNTCDLNGAQTKTNALLEQQQQTLDAIRRSCEWQLEIKKLKLHIQHAVNDSSQNIVEEFLFSMEEGEANGGACDAGEGENTERPYDGENRCDSSKDVEEKTDEELDKEGKEKVENQWPILYMLWPSV